MNIVLFVHPEFVESQSMPRFSGLIADGMRARGHRVDEWTAKALFFKLPLPKPFKRWLGYIDQFIVFPVQLRWRIRGLARNSLLVFSDQALGPWIPRAAARPHVIHVHDLLALRSALGEFRQNPTGWTGRRYQALIRRGFGHGHCFISVSENTRNELHRFLPRTHELSEVVYNGLNFPFRPMSEAQCMVALASARLTLPVGGFLLHVGGNQWYKNREGVLEIYQAYVLRTKHPLPLWMIGPAPTAAMKNLAQPLVGKAAVCFLTGLSNEQVCAAYSAARLLLFPSLAEGFGWPIAEAMACACLVVTTDAPPMTEVGGDAALYIAPRPEGLAADWAAESAARVVQVLGLPQAQVQERKQAGLRQVVQFDTGRTLDAYERIYQQALAKSCK
jgi:glycosyltransferase involved in cell wall biosynthesis